MARCAETFSSAFPAENAEEKSETRLSARVPARVKQTIEMAAALSGSSTTQFMAQAAYREAQEIIEQERVVRLNKRDTQRFLDLLDHPPAPGKKLKAAVAAYKKSHLNAED